MKITLELMNFKYLILLLLIIKFNSFWGQNRYPEKDVVTEHDTVYLKITMNKITGVVYNKHGDIGKYIVGLKDGLHREWFRNGNLKDEITYLNGYKNGEFKYWDDKGQLLKKGQYINDSLEGFIKEWYHNGNIKLEVHYIKGEMHGLRTEWYKSGHKWSEQQMEKGYVVSGRHFYNDGTEITHGNFLKH